MLALINSNTWPENFTKLYFSTANSFACENVSQVILRINLVKSIGAEIALFLKYDTYSSDILARWLLTKHSQSVRTGCADVVSNTKKRGRLFC